MDGSQFDRLAKRLAEARSRRRLVTAAVGAAASLVVRGRRVGAAQTCIPEGRSCGGSESWCCGDTFCVNGLCRRFVSPGEACYSDDECSPSQSSTYYCRDNGMAISPACCGFEGAGCGTDAHCCGDLICTDGACGLAPVTIYGGVPCESDDDCGWPLFCDENGTAVDGQRNCCLPSGGWCLTHADCCGTSLCVDGYCE